MSNYENASATILLAVTCALCGRPLVNPASVESGIGPICAEKYGIDRETAPFPPDWTAYAAAVSTLPAGVVPAVGTESDASALAAKLLHAIAARVAPRGAIEAIEALGYARLAARLRLVWREPKRAKIGISVPGYVCVRSDGRGIVVTTEGDRLGGRKGEGGPFDRYLTAMKAAGMKPDGPPSWAWRGPATSLPALCAALLASEVPCALDDASRRALETEQDSLDENIVATERRIEAAPRSPYPYQREGARWLAGRIGAILGDEMGLGKTTQALLAAPVGGIVVVCPASVCGVWEAEIKHTRPELVSRVTDRKRFTWPAQGQVVIVSYDSLPEGETHNPNTGTTLIFDEAQKVKSSKAARTKNARIIADAVRQSGGRTWALTGTPIKKSPADLWALMTVCGVTREAFPDGFASFAELAGGVEERVARGRTAWQWYPNLISEELPSRMQRVMLRRSKADNLPGLLPKVYQEHTCALDEPKDLESFFREPLTELGILTGAINADRLRATVFSDTDFKLLAKKLSFDTLSSAATALGKAKVKAAHALVELFEEADEPLVLFAVHRCVLDSFEEREGWAVISGDVPQAKRTEIVRRFQAGEFKGVAVSLGAGAEGITLTRSSNVLFVERHLANDQNMQAEDRIHRPGQKGQATIHNLRSNHPFETLLDRVLALKAGYIAAAVDAAIVQKAPEQAPRIDASAMGTVKDAPVGIVAIPADEISEEEREQLATDARQRIEQSSVAAEQERERAEQLAADEAWEAAERATNVKAYIDSLNTEQIAGIVQNGIPEADEEAIDEIAGFNDEHNARAAIVEGAHKRFAEYQASTLALPLDASQGIATRYPEPVDARKEKEEGIPMSKPAATESADTSTKGKGKNGKGKNGKTPSNPPPASAAERTTTIPGTETATAGRVRRFIPDCAVSLLQDNPTNGRSVYEGIEALAESMKSAGLIEPISVTGKDGGPYTIVAGHRRVKAARLLGWEVIPAQVLGESHDSDCLTENGSRKDLKPWEVAEECHRLHMAGESIKAIAAKAGYSNSHVKNLEGFKRKLIPEAFALFKGEPGSGNDEGLGFEWARSVVGLTAEQQLEAVLRATGKSTEGADGDPGEEGEEGDKGPKEAKERDGQPRKVHRAQIEKKLAQALYLKTVRDKDAKGKASEEEQKAIKASTKVTPDDLVALTKTLRWVLGDLVELHFALPDLPEAN